MDGSRSSWTHRAADRLSDRRSQALLIMVAVVLAGAATIVTADRPDQGSGRPEIIMISINSLGADHLSCYGYHRNTTPNICDVAEEGILYENATAAYYWTTPSSTSVLTGLYPEAHGVYLRPAVSERTVDIPPAITTLPERLGDLGYQTEALAFRGPWMFPNGSNILQGFDRVQDMRRPSPIVDRILDRQTGDGPRFTYAQIRSLHEPYGLSSSARQQYNLSALSYTRPDYAGFFGPAPGRTAVPPFIRAIQWQEGAYVYQGPNRTVTLSDQDIRYIRDRYDTTLRWIDDQLGRLFENLKRQGRYEDAMIVVLSPHGENLGDYPEAEFGSTMAVPTVADVPLIIKPPGGTEPRRITGLVELVDLYPTLMSFISGRPPGVVQGQVRRRPGDGARMAFTGLHRLTTPDWIFWSARGMIGPALYRRGAAAQDRTDRYHEHPALIDRFRARLQEHRSRNRLLHARLSE